MLRTPYSHMTTNELLVFTLGRDNSTFLEVELAQRLTIAVDALDEDGLAEEAGGGAECR